MSKYWRIAATLIILFGTFVLAFQNFSSIQYNTSFEINNRHYGFNYYPQAHADWLHADPKTYKDRLEKDIGLMKSMGVNTVRILVGPHAEGLAPWNYNKTVGRKHWDAAVFNQVLINIPAILKTFAAVRIKVIFVFMPNVFYWFGPSLNSSGGWDPWIPAQCRNTNIKWWECRYPNRWNDFVWDYITWMNSIVWTIESDALASQNVLYYDVLNEFQYADSPGLSMKTFVNTVIQYNNVPPGKLGFSVLMPVINPHTGNDSNELATLKADLSNSGKQASFIDVHCYPEQEPSILAEPSIATWLNKAHAKVRSSFPASETKLIVGEFGSSFEGGKGVIQASREAEILDWTRSKSDVAGILHWGIYDDLPSYSEQHRVGASPYAGSSIGLRNNYMVLASMKPSLMDGDFESNAGGWYVGGANAQFSRGVIDSATGDHYGRMKIISPGFHYFCSPNFELKDGWQVATGGFFRTALKDVSIITRYFNSSWALMGEDKIQMSHDGSWMLKQIQEQSLSKRATVFENPHAAQVCFAVVAPPGTSSAKPQYLDLDSISVSVY